MSRIARGTEEWTEVYAKRTAIERIFSRLKSRRGANFTAYDLPRGLLRVGFIAAIAAAAVNLLPAWRQLA